MNGEYEIIQLNEDTWSIEEERVRFFLLTGTKKALLVDSGYFVNDAKGIAESITSLPIELLNTHADRDHIGCNRQFDKPYMHLAECFNYHHGNGIDSDITPVDDGDVIDLGGRRLRVVALPGHTPGSIALLDEKHRVLIAGDAVQDAAIFMFGYRRDMIAFRHSLEKLNKMQDEFDEMYSSHGTLRLGKEIIQKLMDASDTVIAGKAVCAPAVYGETEIKLYDTGEVRFFLDK